MLLKISKLRNLKFKNYISRYFKSFLEFRATFRKIPILLECWKIYKKYLIFCVMPYTLLSYPRLSKLYEIATSLERRKVQGSFVECGVWNGGSSGLIAKIASSNHRRHIWLFDSWEGLPEPTDFDISYRGEAGRKGIALGSIKKVRELLFEKLKLDQKRVHIQRGWFQDTIPVYKNELGNIVLLHLDCDWYESVKFCLDELFDQVEQGGFIFIDDYGHWKGCKRAVDEFFEGRNLNIGVVKIDYTGIYFQK
jgi:O-methyltransferase